MIARLRGLPVARTPEGLVLDVHGVGYLVQATPTALRKAEAGGEVAVETYLDPRLDAIQASSPTDRAALADRQRLMTADHVLGAMVGLGTLTSMAGAPLARAVVAEKLSVRETEARVREGKTQGPAGSKKKSAAKVSPEARRMVEDLVRAHDRAGTPSPGPRRAAGGGDQC